MQIELADPDREWTLKNKWFVKQSNFHVRLTTRKPLGKLAM